MRARMALKVANILCEIREVILRQKPQHLLDISPKGTVPVLLLPCGRVLEESLDIMRWALEQNDPQGWLNCQRAEALIMDNDTGFKYALDRYKYPNRYDGVDPLFHRDRGEAFLKTLEYVLSISPYLSGKTPKLTDISIFPFIRQFAKVDLSWFEGLPYPYVQNWLKTLTEGELFASIMTKYPPWQEGQDPVYFGRSEKP